MEWIDVRGLLVGPGRVKGRIGGRRRRRRAGGRRGEDGGGGDGGVEAGGVEGSGVHLEVGCDGEVGAFKDRSWRAGGRV